MYLKNRFLVWYKVAANFKPRQGVVGTISGGNCDRGEGEVRSRR